ncbi:MAG: VCBS repeat-containing protein, partial [Candidatus Thermoplasmatota archaeon]|nr:VCBS repeat-containing protein [Candidatus Thermoplasmatota archaeon]
MTRDLSLVNSARKRTGYTSSVLMVMFLMVSAPFFALANEDLELVERSTGPSSNGKLGWNVTAVMDLNGDGKTDYAVTSPGTNMVYVFHGPMPQTISFSLAQWRVSGPSSSNFGWSVAGMDSYDGDAYDDLIIGAPDISRAYVFKGRSAPPGSISYTSAEITLEGKSGDMFGHSVTGIDYSNTSNVYAVVGAPRDNHFLTEFGSQYYQTGAVFLFNLTNMDEMSETSVNNTFADFTFQGTPSNGWFGFSVANLGDMDGDLHGRDDLAISDPYFDKSGDTDNGAVFIQNGKDTQFEFPIILSENMNGYIYGRNNSRFGWSIEPMGDVSPSPEPDFMIGAPFENTLSTPSTPNVGCAHLFYGRSSSFQLELDAATGSDAEFWGVMPGDRMGWSSARADITGSSEFSIAVGAPGYDNGTSTDAGAVFSFWGWSISQNHTGAKSKYHGVNSGDNLGYSMEGVYYRSTDPDDVRIMASAPYYGTSDIGSVDLFKRNMLPTLSNLFISPNYGNEQTPFEIKVQYFDLDNNPPEYIKAYIYQDSAGSQLVATHLLGNPQGSSYVGGMNYSKITTLPSSILGKDTQGKPLYFRMEVRATRGSRDIITSPSINPFQNPKVGPVVDGVAPSSVTDVSEISQVLDEDLYGVFKIAWFWPEENAGFDDETENGKVSKLTMAIREGADNIITRANWNDTGELDEGDAVFYINFSNEKIEKPFTQTNNFYVGRNSDFVMNPNSIQISSDPKTKYNVAFRAVDDQNNWGPVSNNLLVESWWRRPGIPSIDSISLEDHTGDDDNGHMLNVSWVPQSSNPSDLHYYWVFIDDKPFDTYSELGRDGPDYNVSRENNYETFLDRWMILEHYFKDGVKTQLQTGTIYYAAVVPFNWLDQSLDTIILSNSVKVIDNDDLPIPRLQEVEGENHLNDGHHIKLTWEKVNDPRFVEYQVWGQSYSFTNIQDAFLVA